MKKPGWGPCTEIRKICDVTLSAAVQAYSITDIPTDFDVLAAYVRNPYVGNMFMSVRPLGLATNLSEAWNFQDWGAAESQIANTTDFLWLATGDPNSVQYEGTFSLDIATGKGRRQFNADGSIYDGTNNRMGRNVRINGGFWNDVATPLTFVDIFSTAAAGLAVGCEIVAWAIKY